MHSLPNAISDRISARSPQCASTRVDRKRSDPILDNAAFRDGEYTMRSVVYADQKVCWSLNLFCLLRQRVTLSIDEVIRRHGQLMELELGTYDNRL